MLLHRHLIQVGRQRRHRAAERQSRLHLELGRIAERLGDKARAEEYYGFVLAMWRRPDPELLPHVAEAREGLARLGVSERP